MAGEFRFSSCPVSPPSSLTSSHLRTTSLAREKNSAFRYEARVGEIALGDYLYESVAGLTHDAAAGRLGTGAAPNFRGRGEYELAVERDVDAVSRGEAEEETDHDGVWEAARARVEPDAPGGGGDGSGRGPAPGRGAGPPPGPPRYAGVSPVGGRYRSHLPLRDGRRLHLLTLGTECAAALAHDRAAAGLGEDVKPNFRCVLVRRVVACMSAGNDRSFCSSVGPD